MENSRETLAARQTYDLTETMGGSTKPTEIQSRYDPNIEGEHWTQSTMSKPEAMSRFQPPTIQ